jgi:hypothetical protein
VPPSHPFYEEVAWAAHEGVVGGYADNTFRPGSPVTRQAMAAFLYGALDGASDPAPPNPGFSDVGPGHPFFLQIAWLVDAGIAEGYGNGTFKPSASITRQAMAAFLFRAGT